METVKFKTNIKCSGCVAKVTPFLDEAVGKQNWSVDYNDPAKVLTVVGDHAKEVIIKAVAGAGYRADSIEQSS